MIPVLLRRLAWSQLQLTTKHSFSIKNYLKTYEKENISRHHGLFRVDENAHYDRDPQRVKEFIRKQRELYEKQSEKWKNLTDDYYAIASSRRDSRTADVPEQYDDYEYYTVKKWKGERQYDEIYRQRTNQTHTSQLVLDIMELPLVKRHQKTAQLTKVSFSPSHRYIAAGVDLRNNQHTTFIIWDTQAKQVCSLERQGESTTRLDSVDDVVFINDHQVYLLESLNRRQNKVSYLNLKTGQTKLIVEQPDAQYYLSVKYSKDKTRLIITAQSWKHTKVWAANPKEAAKMIWQGEQAMMIEHVRDYFVVWGSKSSNQIVLISDESLNKVRLGKGQTAASLRDAKGLVMYKGKENQTIQDIDLIKDHLVLYIQEVAQPKIKIVKYTYNSKQNKIESTETSPRMPYKVGTVKPGSNHNYVASRLLFVINAPFVYNEVYEIQIPSLSCRVVQKFEYQGPKFNSHKYEVSRIDVPSQTMDHIPMTIIGPKKQREGKLLLHFYGCYGEPTEVGYDHVGIAALQKGWTIAYAHIRGGGEKGKEWHTQASGQSRQRSWQDVQECVGYLIRHGYTHPSLLFTCSHSAGAITAWNAIHRKPHLYKGTILRFPFLDVLSNLLDPNQPLSNSDYNQFGNPINSKKVYQQIQAISPYENISPKQYPAVHIMAGQNDYRTPVAQIAKFSDRFRQRVVQNSRLEELGVKGLTVDVSQTASHLGEVGVVDQNRKGCEMFAYMDYVLNEASKDCSPEN